MMKVTPKMLKNEFVKAVNFFRSRESYKKQLRKAMNKYGVVNLPESVQRTIPTNLKVLYEIPWYLNIVVWFRIGQIAWLNTENECIRKVINA